MTKIKKTFLVELIAKRAPHEFKDGLGVGVIASQLLTFELTAEQYASVPFFETLENVRKEMFDDNMKFETTEIENE